MPVIHVSVWEGMNAKNKKKTVEGITKVFEDLGSPKIQSLLSFTKRHRAIGRQADSFIRKKCEPTTDINVELCIYFGMFSCFSLSHPRKVITTKSYIIAVKEK